MRRAIPILFAFACNSHQVGNHGNCGVGGKCEETFFGEKCIGGSASVVAQPSATPSKKPAVRVLDKPPVPDGALPGHDQP